MTTSGGDDSWQGLSDFLRPKAVITGPTQGEKEQNHGEIAGSGF
jgi:hypothetical protein